jgi:hypothetical protein
MGGTRLTEWRDVVKRLAAATVALLFVASFVAGCAPATSATPPPTGSPAPLDTVLAATGAPTAAASTPVPATTKPTLGPPATPTSVAMKSLAAPSKCPSAFGASCFKYEVSWKETSPAGVTISVYGVTKCLDHPDCVLATTTIPPTDMTLLASSGASKASTTFILGDGESYGAGWVTSSGKTLYMYGVVVRAASAGGMSNTVVAWAW